VEVGGLIHKKNWSGVSKNVTKGGRSRKPKRIVVKMISPRKSWRTRRGVAKKGDILKESTQKRGLRKKTEKGDSTLGKGL